MSLEEIIEKLVDAKIAKKASQGPQTVLAEYKGLDSQGKGWVVISGSTEATPISRAVVEANPGDTVSVTIGDGRAVMDANISNPSAGVAGVKKVENTANQALESADDAIESANRARAAAVSAGVSARDAEFEAQTAHDAAQTAWYSATKANGIAETAQNLARAAQDIADAASGVLANLDAFVRGTEYIPTEDETAQYVYSQASVSVGDSVVGLYELVDGEYVPTTDTTAQAEKDYYQRALKEYYVRTGSGTEEDPYEYEEASVSAGDDVTGLYELSNADSFVGQVAAMQADLQNSLDILDDKASALEAASDELDKALAALDNTVGDISGTLADANLREQTVYFTAPFGTTSLEPYETWAGASGAQNAWTSVRPQYDADYPVTFVATQRQSMSQIGTDECSCTDPAIDETATIIDGGRIITNSITAAKIDVESLWAAFMQAEDLIVGKENAAHMEASGTRLSFVDGNGNEVAYIEVNEQTGESTFYMTRSVVVEDMYFGDGLWKFYRRSNRNMSLKWMGGE